MRDEAKYTDAKLKGSDTGQPDTLSGGTSIRGEPYMMRRSRWTRGAEGASIRVGGEEDLQRKKSEEGGVDSFMWGGCSHDVKFGDKFSREFVDESEDRMSVDGLMNSWNNEAGRRVRL